MANKIVALVGMCGAGKSVVTDYYKDRGCVSVYFGDATMEEMARRGLETNEVNEKFVREELRAKHGMAAYAVINLPRIENALKKGHVIVDGLYSWSEYKVLKERFGERLFLLAIFTPRKLRYKRLAERQIRPLKPAQSQNRDHAEIENIEKGGPIAMADFTVVNDGDMKQLHDQLEQIAL